MTTYYLAGPMRGYPDDNFPAFERATKIMREYGLDIISPHEFGDQTLERGKLMGEDFLVILNQCDAIICLPDWEHSPGARAEVAVAFATEKPVYDFVVADYLDHSFLLAPTKRVSVTVPREEQYRKKIPLIGMCGYAQAGKDTVAEHLVKQGWTRVAFADKLREVLFALNPIVTVDVIGIGEMGRETDHYIATYDRLQDLVINYGWDQTKTLELEVRELLQRLGTEAGRTVIDDNLWVNLGEEQIEAAGTPVVVTDCRFPNELQMVRRRGGRLIWIERPGVGPANAHASEHSVTPVDCDGILTNSGSLEDLYRKVDDLCALV